MNADLRRSAPEYVVTLVHGTILGRHTGLPSWIEDSSFFREQLRSKLNGTVKFVPFHWSGANSHIERDKAARKLSTELENNGKLNPNSKHFVIGHSHDGNVARWAVQNAACERFISGIVCLATPFIRVRPRNIEPTLRLASLALWGICACLAGLAVVVLLLGIYIISVTRLPMPNGAPTTAALALVSTMCFCWWQAVTWLLYVLVRPRYEAVFERARHIQEQEFASTDSSRVGDSPLFCAAPYIDGPFAWLSGVRTAAGLPFFAWNPKGYLLYVTTGFIFVATYMLLFFKEFLWFAPLAAAITAIGAGVMYGAAYFVFLLFMFVSKFARAHLLGFGRENVINHLLFDVYVDQSPGSAKATARYYAVSHCSIYENAAVVRDVADWIANIGLAGKTYPSPHL